MTQHLPPFLFRSLKQEGSSSGSANILVTPTAEQDQIKKFVIEQRKGTGGLFRPEPWFPRTAKNRVYDFAENPISVVLSSNGYKFQGRGLIVPTPELYGASTTGKVDTTFLTTGKLKNTVGEQRLLIWGYDVEDQLTVVRSDSNDLTSALNSKRERQRYHGLSHILEAWINADKWEQMIKVALNLLAEEEAVQVWWGRFASFQGDRAPWSKRGRRKSSYRRQPDGDGAASAAPTVSSAGTPVAAPLGKDSIDLITNRLARTDLNHDYFMGVEPERFDIGDHTLYAKRTPFVEDGEIWPTCEFPAFLRDLNKVPREIRKDIKNLRGYFAACFAVISLDGEKYCQATEEELQKDLKEMGIHDRICEILMTETYPKGTWQRVVNEKVFRLDMKAKRKAPDTEPAEVYSAKASKGATIDSAPSDDSESEDSSSGLNAQELSKVIAAKVGHLIGSIPVFDVTNRDHTPSAEIIRFGYFRKFTATTNQDLDKILSGSKGGFEKKPFPMTATFGNPVPSAPAINDVKRLYNLGLMVGLTSSNTMTCANASKISETLGLEGLKDVAVDRYLEEVQLLMPAKQNDGVEKDEDVIIIDEDSGYASPSNSGVVNIYVRSISFRPL